MTGFFKDKQIPWIGYYQQQFTKHYMRFEDFRITNDDKIIASGQDDAGTFKISGKISENGTDVSFVKDYTQW